MTEPLSKPSSIWACSFILTCFFLWSCLIIAGDRVVTDPLSKPFSMGRNLFCVHSKKHMDDIPELKAQKMETNR
jgi:hypothetical protein